MIPGKFSPDLPLIGRPKRLSQQIVTTRIFYVNGNLC